MSDKNGWISIDDALFPLAKYTGDEIVIRTKANNGRWVYQIAIVDEDGKVVIDPCVMCSQCGGTLQWKPHAWNPLSKMPMKYKTFSQWNEIGFHVVKGEKSHKRNKKGGMLIF